MPYRTLCDILGEMRKCYETRNFSHLDGLIEEAQTRGNRMEAALSEKKELEYYEDAAKKAKQASDKEKGSQQRVDTLKAEIKKLEKAATHARHQYQVATKGDTRLCKGCGQEFSGCLCPAKPGPCCDRNVDQMPCDCGG